LQKLSENNSLHLLGLIAGFISGFLAIGGGIILVPALTLLLKYDQKRAQGTSLMIITVSSFISFIVYSTHGLFQYKFTLTIALGSLIGVTMGSFLSSKIPAKTLKKIFSIVLLIAGLRMIL